jgi:hypothetical protein
VRAGGGSVPVPGSVGAAAVLGVGFAGGICGAREDVGEAAARFGAPPQEGFTIVPVLGASLQFALARHAWPRLVGWTSAVHGTVRHLSLVEVLTDTPQISDGLNSEFLKFRRISHAG